MNTLGILLVAALYTQSVCGSYSSGYGQGYDLRYHGPTAIPHVLKDGHIADTHEVAAAKAAHYSAVSVAKAHSGYGSGYGYEGSYGHGNSYVYGKGYGGDSYGYGHYTTPYHGPLAKPVVLKSGYLADTHEVATAKAAHHHAVVSAKAHSGYGSEYGYDGSYGHGNSYVYGKGYGGDSYGYGHYTTPYHGPLAKPVVLKSGYLADTHEVAAAKEAHHHAVVSAKAHSGYGLEYGHEGSYGYGYGNGYGYGQSYGGDSYGYGHYTTPYHGPLAKPVVLKSGYLADTYEVAAAKEAHHHAVVSAKAHSGYGLEYGHEGSYGYGYGNGYGYGQSYRGDSYGYGHYTTPYHGPLAKPVVLKSGYLADTHEVAAAKEHHLHALHSAASHYGYDNKW